MTSLLSIEIPRLESGADPLLLSPYSPAPFVDLAAPVRVLPRGLALQQRAALSARLSHEAQRRQQHTARRHADPHAACDSDEDNENDDGMAAGAEEQMPGWSQRQAAARQRRCVKISDEDLLVDWYEVLRLPQGDGASEEQIRAAYRRRCLETHPDKQKDRSDEAFKQVQRAFDILSDTDTRLAYDSSRPFDDSIPPEKVAEADYYATFGPVFERNKKWSSEPGLPSLGDDRTSLREVNHFYDRWMHFQSWRDFSHLADIEEIDDSMCREEKRYYQRENERQLSHHRREEQKRMRALVQRARDNDPRLRRRREAEEAARQRDIAEREAVRRQAREEEERRRAESAARERAEREAAQRRIIEAKGAVRDAQKCVTAFLSGAGLLDMTPANKLLSHAVRKPNVEWLFSKIQSPEEANAVAAEVTSGETVRVACPRTNESNNEGIEANDTDECIEVDAVRRFNTLLLRKEQQVGETRYGEPIKKNVAPANEAKASKTEKQQSVEWDEGDLVRLQKATAKYPPGTVDRWRKIAATLRGKFTEEDAMAKVNELTAALHGGNTVRGPTSAAGGAGNAAGGTATTAPTATGTLVEDWTMKQQKQLEQGLRELKDYKEKDKFQKLAAMVEGKNAKECFERFKYLCAVNKRK